MDEKQTLDRRTWKAKFADAFRGMAVGIRGQSSFAVHLAVAIAVVTGAIVLEVTAGEWCLLVLCIAVVLAAEMFNTALERLAAGLVKEHNEQVGQALDMAAAAVVLVVLGAVTVGLIIFGPGLYSLLSG